MVSGVRKEVPYVHLYPESQNQQAVRLKLNRTFSDRRICSIFRILFKCVFQHMPQYTNEKFWLKEDCGCFHHMADHPVGKSCCPGCYRLRHRNSQYLDILLQRSQIYYACSYYGFTEFSQICSLLCICISTHHARRTFITASASCEYIRRTVATFTESNL
jgi:hypothetical protein